MRLNLTAKEIERLIDLELDPRSKCLYFSIHERVPQIGCGPCSGDIEARHYPGQPPVMYCAAHDKFIREKLKKGVHLP